MSEQENPWTDCAAHVTSTDVDCEYCEKELEAKQAVLNAIHNRCQDKNNELARMTGTPYIESSPAVAALKADVIVQMIFQDPKARMAYELNFAQALDNQMETVKKHMTRQQILQGTSGVMPTKRTGG